MLYTTFSSYMQYLDVAQHHSYMTLGKVKSNKCFQMQAKVFSTVASTPNDIVAAGEQALVDLYSGSPKEGLNSLHYKRFCE